MTDVTQDLMQGLTRTEAVALLALLEHIGVSLDVETEPTNGARRRTWTRAQRAAHSKRMKAYWRTRNGK